MGGSHCCIVTCGANALRHRGLSFHRIPKKGKSAAQDAWRAKLLAIINREEKNFNPEKAFICSRHFEGSCFYTEKKRKLLLGSLPTKHLPQKSADTAVKPRKEPRSRFPPPLPEIAVYYDFEEVFESSKKLQLPEWSMKHSFDSITFTLLDNILAKITVVVTKDLKNIVTIKGKKFAYPSNAIETRGLKKVLTELKAMKLCPGVCDKELQKYAFVRTSDFKCTDKYSRIVVPGLINGKWVSSSAVYSDDCSLISALTDTCGSCTQVRILLQRKKKREDKRISNEIYPCTSLKQLPKPLLMSLLKSSRQKSKSLKVEKYGKQDKHENETCISKRKNMSVLQTY